MGRISNQTRHRDIAGWGIAAVICGALAVLSVNVGGYIPDHLLTGLQTTRLQGGNFNQIRAQVSEMRGEAVRTASDYRAMSNRLNLLDDDSGEVVRRLAAVERSLPLLIESLPLHSDIDRSLLTASIAAAAGEVYEIDGGTIIVRQSPLFENRDAFTADQPIPPVAIVPPMGEGLDVPERTGALDMQGIAIGPAIQPEGARDHWNTLMIHAGPLLLGTVPLLGEGEGAGQTRIVTGPLPDFASAETLCGRLGRMGIACDPVPYEGSPWPR